VHDFKLLLEAGFGNLFFLELGLERSDIIERDHAATIHIFLAGLPKMVVILFPKGFLLLALL
jgi:hypothetical protein